VTAGWRFVRIRARRWEELRDLERVAELDVFGPTARQLDDGRFEIDGLLSDEDIEQARANGYEVDVLRDAERVAADRSEEQRGARRQQP
jgi:hypothetical protein